MGGGGKGGSSQQEIPQYIEDAQKENIRYADLAGSMGYEPWMGPDVAALTPMQEQAMRGTSAGASAFGLAPDGFDPLAGMPQAQDFGGIKGYSSFPMYEQARQAQREYAPGQAEVRDKLFVDPQTPDNYQFNPHQSMADYNPMAAERPDLASPLDKYDLKSALGIQNGIPEKQGMSREDLGPLLMGMGGGMMGGQSGGILEQLMAMYAKRNRGE